MTLLSVRNLTAGYGDVIAVRDISFEVGKGEVVCLIGANGAGKTTTMAALSGLIKATGAVTFDGEDLLKIPSHQRVASGISLCPEGRKVFPSLTVEENLYLGSFNPNARRYRARKLDEVYELFPILVERRRQQAGLMSGGEQQMLALGRALMASPKLLMLDEPSMGLAPRIVMSVYDAIQRVAKSDISILLVEQNTVAALEVSSRGYVLAAGQIVQEDTAEGLRASTKMQDAFIGIADLLEKAGGAHVASSES
jgi:branched-chain amino acid transport system ATP-binding protein